MATEGVDYLQHLPVGMTWKKPLGSDDAVIGVRMLDELYLSGKCLVIFLGKKHPQSVAANSANLSVAQKACILTGIHKISI